MQCLGSRKNSTCARGDRRRAAARTWNASARGTHPPCKGRSATKTNHTHTQRRARNLFCFLLKSGHAAPPPLVIGMRARNVLMMREVFDAWRHESFRHWPPHVTDLSILQNHLDVACVGAMGSACDGPGSCKGSEYGIDATHHPVRDAWMRLVGFVNGLVEARPLPAPEVAKKKQHQRPNRCHVWPNEIAPSSHRVCLTSIPRA